jgi:nicotinate-nucleotide pyrophosphorylase
MAIACMSTVRRALASIRAVAETGVERISTGAMTHSVTALDLSMRCDVV